MEVSFQDNELLRPLLRRAQIEKHVLKGRFFSKSCHYGLSPFSHSSGCFLDTNRPHFPVRGTVRMGDTNLHA